MVVFGAPHGQQYPRDGEVSQHGGSTVTQKGRGDTGEWEQIQNPAGNQKQLGTYQQSQTEGQEEAVVRARSPRNTQPEPDE